MAPLDDAEHSQHLKSTIGGTDSKTTTEQVVETAQIYANKAGVVAGQVGQQAVNVAGQVGQQAVTVAGQVGEKVTEVVNQAYDAYAGKK
jgi:hypothetical protein